MEAGYGKARLTPPVGIALAGYDDFPERFATHVSDHLHARALVLVDGDTKWLLVCCELLELSDSVIAAARAALRRHGFADERMMFVSVHTPSGPALVSREGGCAVDAEYAKTVPDAILRATENALRDLCRVQKAQRIEAPLQLRFMQNRSDSLGTVDDKVRGLKLLRPGAPAIALVSCACEPCARGQGTGISSDYPGKLASLMQGMHVIYLSGCCLGSVPIAPENVDGHALSERIANDIRAVYPENPKPCALTLDAGRMEIPTQSSMVAGAGHFSVAFARVGKAIICALPFEADARVGERVRNHLPGYTVLVLSCAEQILGRLVSCQEDALLAADALGIYLAERCERV